MKCCSIHGCSWPFYAKNLCRPHYDAKRNHQYPGINLGLPLGTYERQPDERAHVCLDCEETFLREKKKSGSPPRRCVRCTRLHMSRLQRVRRYGITLDRLMELEQLQSYLCAICQQPETSRESPLCIDHCHDTGEVRGLLCLNCNSAVGRLKNNPEFLRRAADYLEGKL